MTAYSTTPLDEVFVAVPDAIAEVSGWDVATRIERAESAADLIASTGDVLGASGKFAKKAEVKAPELRAAIALGLGILAHRPAGVTFAGLHWCTGCRECPGPGSLDLSGSRIGQSERGAYFTPRDLAEEVTFYTLEALVYDPGPTQTAKKEDWRLVPSDVLLSLKTADIACGSGVFVLATCRYLSERLCEIWAEEAGEPFSDPPRSVRLRARRMVMERCVYGADIDPASAELSKLTLALLAPTVDIDLTHNIATGDSLLGITTWDQIASMNFDPAAPKVFTQAEMRALYLDHRVDRQGRALAHALADLTTAAALHCAGGSKRLAGQTNREAAELGRRLHDDPSCWPEVERVTQEWLQGGRPEGLPPRKPLHWPLRFPGVFGWGAPDYAKQVSDAA